MEDESNVSTEDYVDTMLHVILFTQSIQEEIASSLIMNKTIREETGKILAKPDHVIVDTLEKAVNNFLLALPLASMYGVNLIMNMMECHSPITGNNTIHDLCRRAQERLGQTNQTESDIQNE